MVGNTAYSSNVNCTAEDDQIRRMAQPRITVTINGTTYSLCADNVEAISNMPTDDRQHLLTLLEAVRQADDQPGAAKPVTRAAPVHPPPAPPEAQTAVSRIAQGGATPTRMGGGDIDALMAQLAAEEQRNRKPGLTRAGIYKLTGGLLLIVFLLVIML